MLIDFKNVSKCFPHSTGRQLLRTHIARWFGRVHTEDFYALRNVSFRLEDGESLAIVGANGAGKSTLLSLAAGLTLPDEGTVQVNGRIAALLELGSGFHRDLTGAENLVMNAALLGLSKRRTNELFDRIVEFSGIGDFIDDPLRTYSSGMIVRLAFSIAIRCQPDILLLDEVLAVGDASFQEKSREALVALRRTGKSMLFVSHSPVAVREMCDRAIWMDHGAVMLDGSVSEVLDAYQGRTVMQQGQRRRWRSHSQLPVGLWQHARPSRCWLCGAASISTAALRIWPEPARTSTKWVIRRPDLRNSRLRCPQRESSVMFPTRRWVKHWERLC